MFSRYYFIDGLCPIIDSNNSFFINYLGQVKDRFGNDVPSYKDINNDLIVKVKSWKGFTEYKIIDLMIKHFKSINIPDHLLDQIVGFVIDGNKENVQAKNIGYRFKNGKLEVPDRPGFYYIPSYTRYCINKEGILINIRTGIISKWQITKPQENKNVKGGYYFASVYGASGKRQYLGRHRALALVFLDYPDNCDSLVVNHIDGIPGNDTLENLEWVTRSKNLVHAYENNLRNQNKSVLVRNVLTNEIKEYFSISECARALGFSTDETIRQRLIHNGPDRIHPDGTQIKYKDDVRDWHYPLDPKKAVKDAQIVRKIKVRNCLDLTISVYDNARDAEKATGANGATIRLRLNKDDKSPLRGFQFAYLDDARPFPNFTKEEYLKTLNPSNIQVDAKNHLTGEEITFESVKKAMDYFKHRFVESLQKHKQILLSNGWQIKYATEDWIVYDDIEKELYIRTREVMARRESDGAIIIADSSQQMGEVLNLDPKAIKRFALLRGSELYHGYRFRLGISTEPWPV